MPSPDDHQEKDRPAAGGGDSYLLHVIDEMPLRVVFALMFVAFFFVWGAAVNVVKLAARLSHDDNLALGLDTGVTIGAFSAAAVAIVIWRVKMRRK